jgi:hypothetical protein
MKLRIESHVRRSDDAHIILHLSSAISFRAHRSRTETGRSFSYHLGDGTVACFLDLDDIFTP